MKRKIEGHNYNIFTNNKNYVRVSSTYAQKPVHGYAVTAESDQFDLEKGIALAKARCDLKIAEKRFDENIRNLDDIQEMIAILESHQQKLQELISLAEDDLVYRSDVLNQVLESM